jgi:Methyltransferase domain
MCGRRFVFRPKRRHISLILNLVRVTRSPANAYRGVKTARLAIRSGAQQKLSELAPFLALVGHPRTIIEIGAGEGGMLAAFCAIGAHDATIISVDLKGGPWGGGAGDSLLQRRANPKPHQTLQLVRGNSRDLEIVDRVSELAPGGVELLFIDGDHTYDGVAADYRLYSPLVSRGGIIALHDILPAPKFPDCQVDRFWTELVGEKREIISPGETEGFYGGGGTWGGIGVVLTR